MQPASAYIAILTAAGVRILRQDPKSGAVTIAEPIEKTDRHGQPIEAFRPVTLRHADAVSRYLERH